MILSHQIIVIMVYFLSIPIYDLLLLYYYILKPAIKKIGVQRDVDKLSSLKAINKLYDHTIGDISSKLSSIWARRLDNVNHTQGYITIH